MTTSLPPTGKINLRKVNYYNFAYLCDNRMRDTMKSEEVVQK